ncbi:MAG: GNAT family N-acetyltransferase [Bacteroidetes bacterium]|nr:GNAT family N-acetyltransferase [Bacteroidota bacterium]
MQDSSILLKAVSVTEIKKVAELAKVIWAKHYPSIIGQEQVDYMLQNMYNHESLLQQIQEKAQQFYFIISNNETIGFISVTNEKNDCWMLNKFYVLEEKAGKGTGTKVLEEIIKVIQPKKIRLTVNRKNYKSINFYFKNGFKIDSLAVFDIGNGFVMDDFIMVWEQKSR